MSEQTISVLLIEDNIPDAHYVQEMLSAVTYRVEHVTTLAHAHEVLFDDEHQFNVIMLDLTLPDGNGIESFLTVLDWSTTIPVVILTGLSDEEVSIRAVQLGAQDYILKRDIAENILSRSLRYAIERKHAEVNAKRLAVLEQREEFLATLTHDLKNPLIGANRILELMAEGSIGQVSEAQKKILLQLRDSNKVLLLLIQNLIEVYRFERVSQSVHLENTDLLRIISFCIDEIAPIAENREILIKTEFTERLKEVVADSNAIRRVLQNLLDNALKFTPIGGQIVVSACSQNDDVHLEIRDSGPGIPAEEQKNLFKRFAQGKTGKKYTPGTGLGLYLCKQILDVHQGEITCVSKEGEGATFKVSLPAAN